VESTRPGQEYVEVFKESGMNVATWVWPYSVHNANGDTPIPPSAIVLSVNGKPCVGRCGGCGNPITIEETYTTDEARGLLVCSDCKVVAAFDGGD
jgi:hypothetical protein